MQIDLNCDMGEGFGHYSLANDEEMMPYITSANVACGYHAGDPVVMADTVRLCREHDVRVGAHPSFPDLQGFGRRRMELSVEEIEAFVLYQVAALAGFARSVGLDLAHVKPHGALYNVAAAERPAANAIARAIARYDRDLILVGLAGSLLVEAGREAGLRVAREGFADRAYNADGSLRSRRLPGAVLGSPADVARQAVGMVCERTVVTYGGEELRIEVDTLCIHGDTPGASSLAQAVRGALLDAGVEILPLGSIV
jgi:UPF0271 protein